MHVLTTKWSLITSDEARSSLETRVNECATPLSDSVEVHHCQAEEDGMKIVNRILPDMEEGVGFTFREQAAQASNPNNAGRGHEVSIAALIMVIKALLRVSGGS